MADETDWEADTAIEVSRWGHYTNLIARLRSGAELTSDERNQIADILEDKNKMKGRPSSLLKRGRQTAMARQVALREMQIGTEAAVAEVMEKESVSRETVFDALKITAERFPGFGKGRKSRKPASGKNS